MRTIKILDSKTLDHIFTHNCESEKESEKIFSNIVVGYEDIIPNVNEMNAAITKGHWETEDFFVTIERE